MAEQEFSERIANESELQSADTVLDPRLSISVPPLHDTSPITSAPTNAEFQSETMGNTEKGGFGPFKGAIFAVAGIAALGLIGFFGWKMTQGNNQAIAESNKTAQNTQKAPESKKPIVTLSPAEDAQVKKDVGALLETWRSMIEKKDADGQMALYAVTLNFYYKDSGIDRNHVRADRLRAFEKYDSISLTLDNVKITPESTEAATAVYDKTWTFKGPEKIATGSVQQEMHLAKNGGKWVIDGEKDLQVYYINNRPNATGNNANTAANTSNR